MAALFRRSPQAVTCLPRAAVDGSKLHFPRGDGRWWGLARVGAVPGVRERLETIARFSRDSYGSDFAAYRVYRADGLLAKGAEVEGRAGRSAEARRQSH